MKRRLGWLGPALLAVGIAAGIVGTWFMMRSRPEAGRIVDVVAIDREFAVVVRDAARGDRSFVTLLHAERGPVWQAMIPRYAGAVGAPAIAWAANAISVRVVRAGGEPEIWALSTIDATKLGAVHLAKFARGTYQAGPSRPVTATDGTRSFEIVDGSDGTRVVAFDLAHGAPLWQADLPSPVFVMILRAGALRLIPTHGEDVFFDPVTGAVVPARATPQVPPCSEPALPYRCAGDVLWQERSGQVQVIEIATGKVVASPVLD